ncbi:MAG: hypothetical protein RLZZ335_187 [Bacteroidota bacterium]
MSILVGRKAPSFCAKAVVAGGEVVDSFSLDQFIDQKHVILFFYPKDFSSVCPIEMHAFQKRLAEFEQRNVAVVACSTDTEDAHKVWLNMDASAGGIKGVTYPLVSDSSKVISKMYGVLAGDYQVETDGGLSASGPMIAYRGLFFIDMKGIVQFQLVNNFLLVRSVSEVLRMVDAHLSFLENGEICRPE